MKWPKSKHNSQPSLAVDVAPYPIDWKDERRFILFAGFVMGIAKAKGINLRWGGDWNGNFRVGDDGKLFDAPHFEMVE